MDYVTCLCGSLGLSLKRVVLQVSKLKSIGDSRLPPAFIGHRGSIHDFRTRSRMFQLLSAHSHSPHMLMVVLHENTHRLWRENCFSEEWTEYYLPVKVSSHLPLLACLFCFPSLPPSFPPFLPFISPTPCLSHPPVFPSTCLSLFLYPEHRKLFRYLLLLHFLF